MILKFDQRMSVTGRIKKKGRRVSAPIFLSCKMSLNSNYISGLIALRTFFGLKFDLFAFF